MVAAKSSQAEEILGRMTNNVAEYYG